MIPNRNHPFFSPEKSSLNPEKGETSSSPAAVPPRNMLNYSRLPHVGQKFSIARAASEGEDEKEKRIIELTEENSALLDVLDSLNEYLDRTRKERTNDTSGWSGGHMDTDGVQLSEDVSHSSGLHFGFEAATVIFRDVPLARWEMFPKMFCVFLSTKNKKKPHCC
jgi:hypothetical protein